MKLIKNAVIAPLKGTMDSFSGGVFYSDGEFVADSILWRGEKPPLEKHTKSLSGVYIYGGCLFAHFGHFIWESLSRIHTIRQCKDFPIIFISPNDKVYDAQKILFKNLKITNEILLINEFTSVENLIYSQAGSSIQPLYITDEQINALKCFTFSGNKDLSEKIWLSRTKLQYGKLDNEYIIEERLKKIGYKIVYPEMLPLQEQVRLISTSAIVAGCDGSAFFSVIFSKSAQSKFFVFNRRKNIPPTISYVFQKKNVLFEQHVFDLEPVNEEWPVSIFHHPNIDQIIDVLKPIL